MGYVAVSGGEQAIAASLDLTELKRVGAGRSIEVETILAALPELVEQVESEGSLRSPPRPSSRRRARSRRPSSSCAPTGPRLSASTPRG